MKMRYNFRRGLTCTCSAIFLHEEDCSPFCHLCSLPCGASSTSSYSKSQNSSWRVVCIPTTITILDAIRNMFETFKLFKYSCSNDELPLHLYFSCLFERISPLFLPSSSGKIMSFSPLLDLSSTSAMLLGIFVTGGVFARKVHSGTRTLLPYLPVVLLHNHNHHCLDYLISN